MVYCNAQHNLVVQYPLCPKQLCFFISHIKFHQIRNIGAVHRQDPSRCFSNTNCIQLAKFSMHSPQKACCRQRKCKINFHNLLPGCHSPISQNRQPKITHTNPTPTSRDPWKCNLHCWFFPPSPAQNNTQQKKHNNNNNNNNNNKRAIFGERLIPFLCSSFFIAISSHLDILLERRYSSDEIRWDDVLTSKVDSPKTCGLEKFVLFVFEKKQAVTYVCVYHH